MIDPVKRNNNKQQEISHCLRLIQSKNPRDRSFAAKRLGELKARSDNLISLMDDPNGFIRSASAEALGRSVDHPAPEVVSYLLAAIDDQNNYVCAAAVNALGLLKAEQAVEQIDACLNDSTPIVVQAAILAMARIDPSRTVFR